jgi:S-methylmethionine-dependent homocysteine/selenocysteine methylase
MRRSPIVILDGPIGTQLNDRGVATELPLWSAAAIESSPQMIAEIHRDYAVAGATIHTANTFRTKRRNVGDRWSDWTARAIELARTSVPTDHRIAGSISPLADCYRPDLVPPESVCEVEHREMAARLAELRCNVLLCETFPSAEEGVIAVRAAVETGIPTWAALTAGPDATLMSPPQMADAARAVVEAGAAAVLVNCTPAIKTLPFVQAIAAAIPTIPIGVYANAGHADDKVGWSTDASFAADAYAALARQWIEAGATIIGGCCGTGPPHIVAVKREASRHDV